MYTMSSGPSNTLPCEQCPTSEHPIFQILEKESPSFSRTCKACLVYNANSDVFTQGDHVQGVYCVKSGIIKVHTFGESGKDQIIRFAKPGDVLGFRTLLSGKRFSVSATTLEETSLCFIDREEFLKMVELSSRFRERVLQELSQDLAGMVGALTEMAQRSVRSRLCTALCSLAEVYGDRPINLSREDLANYVGTAPETVIRLLSEMKNERLIHVKGRKIMLLDQASIEKMSIFS